MLCNLFLYSCLVIGLMVGGVHGKEPQALATTVTGTSSVLGTAVVELKSHLIKVPAQVLPVVVPVVSKLPQRKAIHIKHENMGLLNAVLAANPGGALRMEYAAKRAHTALKNIDKLSSTKQAINESVVHIVEPVLEFFEGVKSFKSVIQPVLQESLEAAFATSYMKRLFESVVDIKVFLTQEITDKAQVAELCNEFLHFFKDLRKSFTSEVRDAVEVLRKQTV